MFLWTNPMAPSQKPCCNSSQLILRPDLWELIPESVLEAAHPQMRLPLTAPDAASHKATSLFWQGFPTNPTWDLLQIFYAVKGEQSEVYTEQIAVKC